VSAACVLAAAPTRDPLKRMRPTRNSVDQHTRSHGILLYGLGHDRKLLSLIPSMPHGIGAVQALDLALRRPPVDSNVRRGRDLLQNPGQQ
jgi:hypothetical protein